MPTEAQKKAINKYECEKIEQVRLRVPKGKRAIIKKCADLNGESVNGMINRLIDDEIKKVLVK